MLTWDIQQPVITVCSFLGFSLVCIPVYWHLEGMWPFTLRVTSGHLTVARSMERGMCPLRILGWNWLLDPRD